MRITSRHMLTGLCASLSTIALLPACGGANSPTPGTSSNRGASRTSATSATTTSVIAAPPLSQGPRTEKWTDLEVGDCLADPAPTDPSVVTVTIVDCAQAHQAEVYLRAAVAVNQAIADVANRQCAVGLSQYTGQSDDGSAFSVTYLIDSNQDRTAADPTPSTVICLLQAVNGRPLTRSARRL